MPNRKARCSWCGGEFVRIADSYWCESPGCRERQSQHAIALQDLSSGDWVYLYVPLPMQVNFDSAPVRFLLGGGAAGVSKSHMARWGAYRRMLAVPGYEALILRNTWDELDKHHLRLMEREQHLFRQYGIDAQFFRTAREFHFTFPDGTKSIFEGGHMEDPRDVDKYLSRERDLIVADEGVKFQPGPLLELSTRARSTKPAVEAFARAYQYPGLPLGAEVPGGGAVFWVLSNPGGPAAPMLKEMFIDHEPNWENYSEALREVYEPSEWGYIPGDLNDNPYLPDSYERDLAVLQSWRYKQLRHNDWDVVAGQFFEDFDGSVHVRDLGDPGADVDWFISMDWGYVSPGCILWWACLPDGTYYIRHLWKFSGARIPEVAAEIRSRTRAASIPWANVRYVVADPATRAKYGDTGESIQETFARCGIALLMGDNNRISGWQRIRELLAARPDGMPWLVVHPSCRYLIRTIQSAVSDKSNPEDLATSDDHALDSVRYGAMSRPSPTRAFSRSDPRSFSAVRKRMLEHQKQLARR